MATIKDVASHAGVSVTTVSNFINNKKKIKEQTRTKIIEAIRFTGYTHNSLAASLKRKKTGMKSIGIISLVDQNPFFHELFFELEKHCFENGYAVISCFQHENKSNLEHHIELLRGRIDAILMVSFNGEQTDTLINHFQAIPILSVTFDAKEVQTPNGSTKVILNNELGGYVAARYILSKGHRNITCVTGPKELKTTQSRIKGLMDALNEWKLPQDTVNYLEGDFTYESGLEAMYKIFSQQKLPTAIICHNDLIAAGVLNAANELGIKVPSELSVIGYDGIKFSSMTFPSLTTIRIPLDQLAGQAIEAIITLIKKIKLRSLEPQKMIISVTPNLVIRNSVNPIDYKT